MLKYPSIYEINTRVWLNKFNTPGKKAKLIDVPVDYWQNLVRLGIDYIWLMGVWKTCDSTIDKYCFEEGLKQSYSKALKDWKHQDIIGSPYSIDRYEINPIIGNENDLIELRKIFKDLGLKLILDFIPNHYSADSNLVKSNPEIFLRVDEATYRNEQHTYYQPNKNEKKYFAHGRDPFFPAWQDTIQVNFCSKAARLFHTQTLINLSRLCDGVRCDMAMLALNNVFKNTWRGVVNEGSNKERMPEFWKEAISTVKKENSNFLFLAEAYWDMEWSLQQLGFDFTYDKSLTDRLKKSSAESIQDHLHAEIEYQNKSLRFIENHDEERAVTELGKEKSKAAAVIISTIPGAKLYHNGQFEGRKIKLPVQLGREPEEIINNELKNFYEKLLAITSHKIFKRGDWKLLTPAASWENNFSFKNILAWEFRYNDERRIIAVNYSSSTATCKLMFDIVGYVEEIVLVDLLNDENYSRSAEDIYTSGLYIELKPFHTHIFNL